MAEEALSAIMSMISLRLDFFSGRASRARGISILFSFIRLHTLYIFSRLPKCRSLLLSTLNAVLKISLSRTHSCRFRLLAAAAAIASKAFRHLRCSSCFGFLSDIKRICDDIEKAAVSFRDIFFIYSDILLSLA